MISVPAHIWWASILISLQIRFWLICSVIDGPWMGIYLHLDVCKIFNEGRHELLVANHEESFPLQGRQFQNSDHIRKRIRALSSEAYELCFWRINPDCILWWINGTLVVSSHALLEMVPAVAVRVCNNLFLDIVKSSFGLITLTIEKAKFNVVENLSGGD